MSKTTTTPIPMMKKTCYPFKKPYPKQSVSFVLKNHQTYYTYNAYTEVFAFLAMVKVNFESVLCAEQKLKTKKSE